MSKPKRRIKLDKHEDSTPERIRHAVNDAGSPGEAFDYVDPSRMDSRNPIMLVRRFRTAHLDRFYRKDDPKSILTDRQYAAGDWYRCEHERAGFGTSVISSYGERTSGGEPSYGMPRTHRQANARQRWREGRQQFSRQMVGFMDRFLIHDALPKYAGGKCRMKAATEIAGELDALADWLRIGD